jgi:hypothetical protein
VTPRLHLLRSAPLFAALTAVAVLGTAPTAQAARGDNGTVKVHRTGVPVPDSRDNPTVCAFYLDAFKFDSARQVSWHVDQRWPNGTLPNVLTGSITLAKGVGHTGTLGLLNGRYTIFWKVTGEKGKAKQKVFSVACPSSNGPRKPVHHHLGPRHLHRPRHHHGQLPGGIEAGGGGTVKGPDTAELVGGAGLLIGGVAGSGALMMRRRRSTPRRRPER